MFTAIDKAIVALIGSIFFLLNTFAGVDIYTQEIANMVSVIISALTPVLTYLVPNKTP